jgi:hypothetical protein
MRGHHIVTYGSKSGEPNQPVAGIVPSTCGTRLKCLSAGHCSNVPQFHTSSESGFALDCSQVRKFRRQSGGSVRGLLDRFTHQICPRGRTAYCIELMQVSGLLFDFFTMKTKSCLTTYAS